MRVQPLFRVLDHVHAPALYPAPARLGLRVLRGIVVKLKTPIQARGQTVAVEDNGADKSGSMIAILLQQFRPGGVACSQGNREVGYTVRTGEQAGQDAGVRGVGDRARSKRSRKTNAGGGQGIER